MAEIDIEIDGLTNSVIHRISRQIFPTIIRPYPELTTQQAEQTHFWRFDWKAEVVRDRHNVVALLLEGFDSVQGLISFEPDDDFVLVHLLESAPHNIGQNKLFRGVPGNLIAYACSQSFQLEFDGFVAFHAKSELIEHYKVTLGAQQVGSSNRMIIDTKAALKLVQQYFQETDQWPF